MALLVILPLLFANVYSQSAKTPLQEHISKSELIIVAKCIDQRPVDIIGRSDTSIEVVHVLKGKAESKLSFRVRERMAPGQYYLMTFRSATNLDESSGRDRSTLAIPIVSADEARGLNAFSLEIVLLRTLNLRISRLESDISLLTYELDDLKKLGKGH